MYMNSNLGTADKIIRILIGVVTAFLIFNGTLSGGMAIGVGLVAGILTLTAFIGFCPIYAIFKISSKRKIA
jgi:hypothetical protein